MMVTSPKSEQVSTVEKIVEVRSPERGAPLLPGKQKLETNPLESNVENKLARLDAIQTIKIPSLAKKDLRRTRQTKSGGDSGFKMVRNKSSTCVYSTKNCQ